MRTVARSTALIPLALFAIPLVIRPAGSLCAQAHRPQAPGITDNSFMIEEAYNQEPGVVQHISSFHRSLRDQEWIYTFTQEWPLRGQQHQFSFTLPIHHVAMGENAGATGVGDIGLNYRYQLLDASARVAAAARLSLLLPTGNERRSLGNGGWGIQGNLPVSIVLSSRLVTHWNAGATVTPAAKNEIGQRAELNDFNLGASIIWLARRTFHVLCEVSWTRTELITGPGETRGDVEIILNPGVRWAYDFTSGLQIVPGVAIPIGLGPSRGERGLFLYLSFEHAFRRKPL